VLVGGVAAPRVRFERTPGPVPVEPVQFLHHRRVGRPAGWQDRASRRGALEQDSGDPAGQPAERASALSVVMAAQTGWLVTLVLGLERLMGPGLAIACPGPEPDGHDGPTKRSSPPICTAVTASATRHRSGNWSQFGVSRATAGNLVWPFNGPTT
jgi:hypothetical protein